MSLLYETFVGKVKKFNKGYILQTSSKAHISLLNYKNPTCSIPKCQISLRVLPHKWVCKLYFSYMKQTLSKINTINGT